MRQTVSRNNMSHMWLAALTTHMKQKRLGCERRPGHQFNPDTSRFKHPAEGGPGSNNQTTTPKSPCGHAEDKWLGGITRKWN